MTIQISITADTGAEARQKLADLLGAVSPAALAAPAARVDTAYDTGLPFTSAEPKAETVEAEKPTATRKRRTKAEMEAELAAEKAAGQPERQISATPEDRQPAPENAATQAQDAADEANEAAATKTPELTHDDVRNKLGAYVKAYGLAAAQEDGPKLITLVCGEGKVKVSDIPEKLIAKVVAGVEEMTQKNPYNRQLAD